MRQDGALRESVRGDAAPREGPASQRYALATTDAELLLRHAADHATAGRLDAALFAYLGAALSALDHRGAIRLARHTTNGEYLRSCREDAARPPLRALVRDVDRVQFGGVPPSAELVVDARARALAVVRGAGNEPGAAVRAATMALLVVMLGGCGWNPMRGGDDPAGNELLVDVLEGQGADVSELATSLVKLPAAEAGDAIVVVDTERTALDDETRAHLMRWVEAGGELVLAGRIGEWPADLGAKAAEGEGREVLFVSPVATGCSRTLHGKLASGAAMTWPSGGVPDLATASLDTGELYASVRAVGDGRVLAIASRDLLTNVGLAAPGNASMLVALLAALEPPGKPPVRAFRIARAEQGVSPPSNPLAALVRVGLGPALAQGLVFALVLFAAVGTRQSRPTPEGPPRRRAFAEHVEATGALYARTRAAGHALAAYARYADERLRAKMPRGSDPASFLALRSGADPDRTAALYARAMAARADDPKRGDELAMLRELSGLFAAATRATPSRGQRP
jgi:hypothetical protein